MTVQVNIMCRIYVTLRNPNTAMVYNCARIAHSRSHMYLSVKPEI